MLGQPMEEEGVVDNIEKKTTPTSSPPPSGTPSNWGLLSGPIPEVSSPSPSSCSSSPPPQGSAVHPLQTKVKALTQRRQRGKEKEREREKEREKDKLATEVPPAQSVGQTSADALPRQRAQGKGKVSPPVPPWRSDPVKDSSSSEEEEEEEVEVQVRLEIHSPPAETQGEQGDEGAMGKGAEGVERGGVGGQISSLSGQPRGLGKGLENLLSDNSSSSKDDPAPPPQPAPSSFSGSTSTSTTSPPSSSSSTSSSSARHWAPPKGFWRVARPETLQLNWVGPHNISSSLPLKDYTQTAAVAEPQRRPKPTDAGTGSDIGGVVEVSDALSEFKHSDSLQCYLDRYEQKEAEPAKPAEGLWRSESLESMSSHGGTLFIDERVEVKQRVRGRSKERRRCTSREEEQQSGGESSHHYGDRTCRMDCKGAYGFHDDDSDTVIPPLEVEPYPRSLFLLPDELPLSPRHEQAKRLLERARLKAQSNHVKGDRPSQRSHSDQRYNAKRQQAGSTNPTPPQQAVVMVKTKDELTAPLLSAPLLTPHERAPSPGDQAGRSRRYSCSPTRVRFEDESEKEATSRYLDRLRERGATKSKGAIENSIASGSSGSDRGRGQRSISVPPSQRQEDMDFSGEPMMVIKEVIVVVKKCEACGSIVRGPPLVPLEPQTAEPQQSRNLEEARGKMVPRWVPPNKPEVSTRPKAPLTVTFAGAFVLGQNKDSRTGWRTSGFGKLRRRSRKGESRLESGHGPYGPSWAQRRNSNPRTRVNVCRAVSFAPGSPIALGPPLVGDSGVIRDTPTHLPIKSALKSSLKNRAGAGQPSVQFRMPSNQDGAEGDSQHLALLDSAETKGESPLALTQGPSTTTSLVPCLRPFTLRYSPAILTPDLPPVEAWDATPDEKACPHIPSGLALSGDSGSGSECRPVLRSLAVSRAEDLRAELLRAKHLKAEAMWENTESSRRSVAERDVRPKLSLRRFFSSIGLNSIGRLVKGGRFSSMEQLSLPTPTRASSASPSPTRRPQATVCIQRRPSLQALTTVLPLAQLRKASSAQSLERRTERSTILGEVQIPYGLAPSPDSPQIELHRALSVEDVLASRVVRPVGRVTQAFPDGTLLLELTRPPNGPFGFLISRGKGRPDTGVYVEQVGDGAGEGLYVGLLGVGDEILQVNGEAVAGLTLDQVTRLMTRDSTASIRIMPSRRNQR